MAERDEFDRIVEGLGLELEFPEAPPEPPPSAPEPPPLRWEPEDDDVPDPEPFYRQVAPAPVVPRRRGVLAAWVALIGAPAALGIATLFHVFLDRAVMAAAALIFVAAAIYLVLQLPEHGPSRRDWPDDGAVL